MKNKHSLRPGACLVCDRPKESTAKQRSDCRKKGCGVQPTPRGPKAFKAVKRKARRKAVQQRHRSKLLEEEEKAPEAKPAKVAPGGSPDTQLSPRTERTAKERVMALRVRRSPCLPAPGLELHGPFACMGPGGVDPLVDIHTDLVPTEITAPRSRAGCLRCHLVDEDQLFRPTKAGDKVIPLPHSDGCVRDPGSAGQLSDAD